MRINFPVTQVEYPLADDDLLISRTNLKGQITYANPSFVRVSGFSLEALLGANHNLVRHPDMPPAAFADFWATIRRGEVWSGLVKNRRKNGDHYWVRANAVALKEQGRVVGYASLRVKPAPAEVKLAEAVYSAWRDGKGKRYTLQRGQICRRHPLAWLAGVHWRSATLQTRLLTLVATATIGGLLFHQWRLSSELLPLGAGLLALALVLGLGMSVWARIPRAIKSLRGFVLQVAAGNLTVEPPAHGRDDVGQLVEALATMKKGLGGIVQDVNHGTERVSPSVAGIRQSNASITRESENLATSVQQTAASTEQLTATVTQNADHARQASQLALSNVKEVRDSGEGMARVVQRMAAITDSARHMTETVSLIDTIAFQTNILALNASVEAARAGEHGKGFGVVASEVRTLANRSAEAAKAIHRLIEATNSEIEAGGKVVEDTAGAIARVVEASNRVNDIMGEISAASVEQSSGIAQIASALSTMEHGVQHTTSQMQATDASTQALAAETHQLINAIRAFRTVSDGRELQPEITA
ncbi:methyl-accepting chemotaxis protein [Billgrantia kenyensis]|jgi:aerotaxis receptor|uniref:PAS domain-containing protein n=1 Tax=Billgrantia kenyensis TaxID=321266 RepID=A0A7V9W474_9GAMM|nr:PAS domain-containing methyl-accepting chemotaxis protein [Halomonas kenyensis]MBA2780768.1 PAS domain-containing protein [Halomonas kenyensis]MCG6663593.1 PAS domain-containing protein [Halomonas kenyensis]